MQTSSNFFNKNLFALEDYSSSHKRNDKHHQSHIVADPLRLKDQLTPWTEINPKYNFNTERLIRFKQKTNQDQMVDYVDYQMSQVKEIKSDMISNLFNFYKNNKEKKRSTLNNAKRKSQQMNETIDEEDNSWTLPPIDDRQVLEDGLVQNKQSIKKSDETNEEKDKPKKDKKQSVTCIESISIRQYLMKLKEKERVFASSSPVTEKTTAKDHIKSEIQEFTSNRHSKLKNKPLFGGPINSVKDLGNQDISYRYAPIRNPQNQSYKKRPYLSPLQSLEQSFEIYKKAAQQQVQENTGGRNFSQRYSHLKSNGNANGVKFGEKQYWKNNVPLSSLLSSPVLESVKRSSRANESLSPVKKYSTISYSRSFSPTQNSVQLPKIGQQNSNRR